MRLLVAIPANRIPERTYVIDTVFRHFLGLNPVVTVDEERRSTLVKADGSDQAIEFVDGLFGVDDGDWLQPSSIPSLPLARWRRHADSTSGLPLLYSSPLPNGQMTEVDNDTLTVGADLLGSIFFLLTQYEELANPVRDAHGRFLAEHSILSSEDELLQEPLADRYVEVLSSFLLDLWPQLSLKLADPCLRITCDVDHPLSIRPGDAAQVFTTAAGDVIRRRDVGLAARRLRELITRSNANDPNNTFELMISEAEHVNADLTFYFPVGKSDHSLDSRTPIDHPWMVGLLQRIADGGHEIGLHPSYGSTAETIGMELDQLTSVLEHNNIGAPVAGGRQHFLRWANPSTWRAYHEVGLGHDASLGFADRPGFRAGTARDYPVFDLELRKPLDVMERPLHLMDATVMDYLALEIGAMSEFAARLAVAAYFAGGSFNLLWHNNRLVSARQRKAFRETLATAALAVTGRGASSF